MADITKKTFQIPNVSRRSFVRNMGLAAGALASGGFLTAASASGLKKEDCAPKIKTKSPALKIKQLNASAEKIYSCKTELSRYDEKNMPFKQVSMELGVPFFAPLLKNLQKAVKESRIGHGVKVKNPDEARTHVAFNFGAGTWNNMMGPYGEGEENIGNLSWNPLYVPKGMYEHPLRNPDPADLSKKIKQMSRMYGADMSGICRINRKWIYNETCRHLPTPDKPETKPIVFKNVRHPEETAAELVIPESVTHAIVFLIAMPHASTQIGPASIQSTGAVGMGYGRVGLTAVAFAEAIRSMGYNAIPCMNDTGLSVPMAIDAGLGQLGRLGYLVTPWFGPHVRIGKVLTDMPLVADAPIDFGVTEYCTACGICARECPAGAISADRERTYTPPVSSGPCGNPGALKWYIDGKKCLRWWIESGAGSCSRCMAVCPYTRMNWTDYYDGNPDPERFWDLEIGPFGYRSVAY